MFRLGFYIIISAIVVNFLLSCGREEKELFPLGPDIKEWASFKEGSYWIYQNDSTGMEDSLFVGYNGTEIYPSADGTHNVETVNTTITNKNNILLGFIFALGIKDVTFEDTGYEVEYSCAAGFTLQEGQVNEEKVGKGYFVWSVSRMDDTEVNNTEYRDIIKIEANQLDEDRNIIENISNVYWISKNNWIIKKIYREGNKTYSWSLLRKNIIQ